MGMGDVGMMNRYGDDWERTDVFGYSGGAVGLHGELDMGDGTYAITDDYKTVRLPAQFGGNFVPVIHKSVSWCGGTKRYLLAGEVSVIVANHEDSTVFHWVKSSQLEAWLQGKGEIASEYDEEEE
tara:strand:- start:2 stop:376 length:375 start_codon:yes stop_codon:yes gene_type:complete